VQSAKTTPQIAQPEVTATTFYPQIPQIGADFLREGDGSKLPSGKSGSKLPHSRRMVPPLGFF